MARRPRLDFPGARHHVMNRSSGGTYFLVNDASCAMFLDVVAEVPERFGAHIHGYALMPNHYHLMVSVPRGNISEVMRYVGGQFTRQYNRAMRRDGALFRGRFHNRVVQTDAYWMHLLAYLALNPVKAGIAARAQDCIWTHHQAYVGIVPPPEWLTTSELLGLFGSPGAIATYVDEVRKGRQEAPDTFDPDDLFSPPETEVLPPEPGEVELRTPDEALAEVARLFDIPVERVLETRRGPNPNASSWIGVWWLLQATDLTQRQVAARLGVTRARVSQIRSRAMKHYNEDGEARRIMDELTASVRPR